MKMKLWMGWMVTVAGLAGLAGCATSQKKELMVHELWTYSDAGAMTRHEVWSENHHGGGTAFLADPASSEVTSYHTNQTALGGSSGFTVGKVEVKVSTNAAPIISATGAAVGTAVSNAVK
jgi:hypothetical protein